MYCLCVSVGEMIAFLSVAGFAAGFAYKFLIPIVDQMSAVLSAWLTCTLTPPWVSH